MRFRYAVRTLASTPVVTLVAIVSLALGIGANTAIFSVFDQILLEKLPVPNPETLANLSAHGPRRGRNSSNVAGPTEFLFSYPMFRDLQKSQTVFTELAAHCGQGVNLSYEGQSSSGSGMFVSGSYFPAIGLVPGAGRLLSPEDDNARGAQRVAVISHEYWTTHFGGSAAILNRQLLVDGVSLTIVGVAPVGFHGTSLGLMPDVYIPIGLRETIESGWKGLEDRRNYWVYLFGRRKPGVTLGQAEASLNPLFHNIIRDVDLPLQKEMSDTTRARFRDQPLLLTDGSRGQSEVLTQAAMPLSILLAITGFVLLIACANIANLLLARAAGRSREISIRLAVGAGRAQLIRQLLAESFLLALAGAIAGLAISTITIRFLIAFLPQQVFLPLSPDINPRSLGFALLAAVLTGLLFGLFPAAHSTRADLTTALKDEAGAVSSSAAAARFRKILVTGQMALSILLLISAGLFLKSLVKVLQVNLGLRTQGILTFQLSPERNQYKPEQIRNFYLQVEEKLAAVPGVESLTVSSVPLLSDANFGTGVSVEGFDAGLDTDRSTQFNRVGPAFFRTFAVPVLAGREFSESDGYDAPKVAVVNEAFKRKFSPNSDIVGKRIKQGTPGEPFDTEIAGLVRDTKYSQVKDPPPPILYLPYRQDKDLGGVSFYVLVRGGPPAAAAPAVRQAIASLDPNLPVENIHTFEKQMEENVFIDRMVTMLAAVFAALATVLAGVGLYGVMAYSVARRTREFGIRLAIGAHPTTVRVMIWRETAVMAGIGVMIGVPCAIGLGRFAESNLFGIKSYDAVVVGSASVLMFLIALGAGYFPALWAMRVSPQTALRHE